MSDADKHGHGKGDDQKDLHMQGTFAQKALIITLIIVVGVIFGFAPSLTYLAQPTQANRVLPGGVTEKEVRQLMRTQVKVMAAMYGQEYSDEFFGRVVNQDMQGQMHWAALMRNNAEEEGLLLSGDALDERVKEFLATPVMGADNRTLYAELQNRDGDDGEVTYQELADLVQAQSAQQLLGFRYVSQSAAPMTAGRVLHAMQNDTVVFDAVELTVEPFLADQRAALETDTAAVERAYLQLRDEGRFAVPEKRGVSVILAEPGRILPSVTVSDAKVEAHYESNKSAYLRPGSEGADSETKPLKEVAGSIRSELALEAARDIARKLISDLDEIVEQEGLSDIAEPAPLLAAARTVQIGPEQDPRLEDTVGLAIHAEAVAPVEGSQLAIRLPQENVVVTTISNNVLQFGQKEPGWLSNILSDANREGVQLMVRINRVIPADVRPLEEVRDEVVTWLAARNAWPQLRERAQELSEELSGQGALAEWAESDAAEELGAVLTTREENPLTPMPQPPAEPDSFASGDRTAVDLVAEAPVAMVRQQPLADILRLQLVQAQDYQQAEADTATLTSSRQMYATQMNQLSQAAFQRQISERSAAE